MSTADQALLEAKTLKQLEKALAAGANLEATDEDQRTKLLRLCRSKSGAMSKTEEQLALVVIDKGANLHAVDEGGVGALHYAARAGSRTLVELLLARGVKPTLTNLAYTPLHYCTSTHYKDAKIWDALLAAGNPLDAVNKWGETPLYSAQSSWNPTAVKYFLAKGASTTHQDSKGKTLVERATELKQDKILALLK